MNRVAWIGLVGLALAGTHSFVYACDHSKKGTAVVISTQSEAAGALVPEAPVGCGTVNLAPVMTFEVDVPAHTNPRVFHFVATGRQAEASHPVVRTARAAMTLGRAIKTTVEAVMGTIVTAAAEKTAEIV